MKILHTSDWHLGKYLESFSRIAEQRDVLEEICGIAEAENVDAVIVAGDLFDTFNPSAEAVELLFRTLKRLADNGRRPVIALAGNHDAPERIDAPDPLARECGIIFCGSPDTHVPRFSLQSGLGVTRSEPGFLELALPSSSVPLRVLHAPYANELRLRAFLGTEDKEAQLRDLLARRWNELGERYCDGLGVNLLAAHLFLCSSAEQMPEEPEDERPILHVGGAQAVYASAIPAQVQYAALGHLHRAQGIGGGACPAQYCGSPLCYSFGEAAQAKQVSIVDVAPGRSADVRRVLLTKGKPLLRATFGDVGAACAWLAEHREALVELTMETSGFLTARERVSLHGAHAGIVGIVPLVTGGPGPADLGVRPVDVTRPVEHLFAEYFSSSHGGQAPAQDLMALLREVLGTEAQP